jgi:hypothetical protein
MPGRPANAPIGPIMAPHDQASTDARTACGNPVVGAPAVNSDEATVEPDGPPQQVPEPPIRECVASVA